MEVAEAAEEEWEEDNSAGACRACKATFTIINRRHHCRSCGMLFCKACTERRAFIWPHRASRVCEPCFAIHSARALASSDEEDVRVHAVSQVRDVLERTALVGVKLKAMDALLALREGCEGAAVEVAVLECFQQLAQDREVAEAMSGVRAAMEFVRAALLDAVSRGHEQMLLLAAHLHLLFASVEEARRRLVGLGGLGYLLQLAGAPRGSLPMAAQDMLLEALVDLALDPWCAAELYDLEKGVRMLIDQASSPEQSSLQVSALMALVNIADLGTMARLHMVEQGALPVLLARIQDPQGGAARRVAAEVLFALVVERPLAQQVMAMEGTKVVGGLARVLFSNQALKAKNVRLLCGLLARLTAVEEARPAAAQVILSALSDSIAIDGSTASCIHISRCICTIDDVWLLKTVGQDKHAEEQLRLVVSSRLEELAPADAKLLYAKAAALEQITGWKVLPPA
mmetsp:Transcript_260/g.915  ORF Transcript_260/g.915 Transcript_260/m.915 type:complete len:457 (+) Transcript_260:20-1390(+)